jgi:hypothetical protein
MSIPSATDGAELRRCAGIIRNPNSTLEEKKQAAQEAKTEILRNTWILNLDYQYASPFSFIEKFEINTKLDHSTEAQKNVEGLIVSYNQLLFPDID